MEEIRLGDVIQTRKAHPCGSDRWQVIRIGADIKIKCLGCGRVVMMERPEFVKRRKKILEQGPVPEAETLRQAEYDDYKLRLQHYTSMANAEQKASGGVRANTGAAAAEEKKASLSSAAAQSLQRAMSNYFKGGETARAAALAQQYRDRMTPAQKQRVRKLFADNGAQIDL